MHLAECGASAGAGGVFGLIGNLATKAIAHLESKQSLVAQQMARSHEIELLKLQSQWRQPQTDVDALCAEPFAAKAAATHRWVNDIRALVRPVLTVGLSAVLAAAFFSMASNDVARTSVADALIFAATTAIVWWFGDRAAARKS